MGTLNGILDPATRLRVMLFLRLAANRENSQKKRNAKLADWFSANEPDVTCHDVKARDKKLSIGEH